MIHLVDANSLIYLEHNNVILSSRHYCYITDEVRSEFNIGPSEEKYLAKCSFLSLTVDKSRYLQEYKRVLNAHRLLSFYNMKGVGDLSILATACVLAENFNQSSSLFPNIVIITGDKKLTSATRREFPTASNLVVPQTAEEWLKSMTPFANPKD